MYYSPPYRGALWSPSYSRKGERSHGGCTCLCRCPSGIWNLCTYNWDLAPQKSDRGQSFSIQASFQNKKTEAVVGIFWCPLIPWRNVQTELCHPVAEWAYCVATHCCRSQCQCSKTFHYISLHLISISLSLSFSHTQKNLASSQLVQLPIFRNKWKKITISKRWDIFLNYLIH